LRKTFSQLEKAKLGWKISDRKIKSLTNSLVTKFSDEIREGIHIFLL